MVGYEGMGDVETVMRTTQSTPFPDDWPTRTTVRWAENVARSRIAILSFHPLCLSTHRSGKGEEFRQEVVGRRPLHIRP